MERDATWTPESLTRPVVLPYIGWVDPGQVASAGILSRGTLWERFPSGWQRLLTAYHRSSLQGATVRSPHPWALSSGGAGG
jgi:hypothetical protein